MLGNLGFWSKTPLKWPPLEWPLTFVTQLLESASFAFGNFQQTCWTWVTDLTQVKSSPGFWLDLTKFTGDLTWLGLEKMGSWLDLTWLDHQFSVTWTWPKIWLGLSSLKSAQWAGNGLFLLLFFKNFLDVGGDTPPNHPGFGFKVNLVDCSYWRWHPNLRKQI